MIQIEREEDSSLTKTTDYQLLDQIRQLLLNNIKNSRFGLSPLMRPNPVEKKDGDNGNR